MAPQIFKLDVYNVLTPLEDRTTVESEPLIATTDFDGGGPALFYPVRHRWEGTADTILKDSLDNLVLVLSTGEIMDGVTEINEEIAARIVQRARDLKEMLAQKLTE